jgi:hypothetical protein
MLTSSLLAPLKGLQHRKDATNEDNSCSHLGYCSAEHFNPALTLSRRRSRPQSALRLWPQLVWLPRTCESRPHNLRRAKRFSSLHIIPPPSSSFTPFPFPSSGRSEALRLLRLCPPHHDYGPKYWGQRGGQFQRLCKFKASHCLALYPGFTMQQICPAICVW